LCKVSKKNHTDKYNLKKKDSLTVAECFEWSNNSKIADRIFNCANFIHFLECAHDDFKKFSGYFSCGCRMCPFCQFRKSRKIADQVCKIAHYALKEKPTYQFLFLTLTIPNVKSSELSNTITHMLKSWDRLGKRAEVKRILKGYFRSLEVKYNPERDDYQPHFHILLFVPKNYFAKNYIKRNRWLGLWQEATNDYSITQVDIRKVKPKEGKDNQDQDNNGLAGAAAEVGKYATDAKDYLSNGLSDEKKAEVITALHEVLRGRQIHAYGGMFKDIKAKLKLLSIEDPHSELSDVEEVKDCFCPVCSSELKQVLYQHNHKDYVPTGRITRPDKLVKAEKAEERTMELEEELGRLQESEDTQDEYQARLRTKIGNVKDGPKTTWINKRVITD